MDKELTIFKANSKIKSLENQRETKLELKDKLLNKIESIKPMPKSKVLSEVMVSGGQRSDKYLEYIIKDESLQKQIEEIDSDIEWIDTQIRIYEEFIEKELRRLKQYDEYENLVIYLRVEKNKKWEQILPQVPFSLRSCHRIIKNYYQKREI